MAKSSTNTLDNIILRKNSEGLIKIKTYGYSMAPFFLDGDLVYLRKIGFGQIRVNDFITFRERNHLVTHRVVYVDAKKKVVITKGDNNLGVDRAVSGSDVIGKVVKVERNGKVFDPGEIYLIQSTLYWDEIRAVNALFLQNKLDFVFLKGLPLHLYFEKKYPQRFYADCDILIRKEDLDKVTRLFKKIGFKRAKSSLMSSLNKSSTLPAEINFFKTVNGLLVTFDIHLEAVFLMSQIRNLNALYPNQLLDQYTESLLSEKQLVELFDEQFPILGKEQLLVYLALHLFHHNFRGHYRYEFLGVIARLKSLDWEKISQEVKIYQLEGFIYPILLLLQKYYGIPLPSWFMNKTKPKNGKVLKFIKENVLKVPILSDEMHIASGINRFKYIYHLSPNPDYLKIFIFINPSVLYSMFWVNKKRIWSFWQKKLLRRRS